MILSAAMGKNDQLERQLQQAGQLHGHICPSLFYGVSLAMQIKEWLQTIKARPDKIILEGKSGCIKDGVRSVFGGIPLTIENTGHCALTAIYSHQQQQYRLSIYSSVRSIINGLNKSLPLEEFKKEGVAYLKSLSPKELFEEL